MPRTRDADGRFSIVLVTCPAGAAERIAKSVLDKRAAACVNILPGVKSLYRWKGKVEGAKECLLLIKTRTAVLGELESVILAVHPYEVPEIIALAITHGHERYLKWISESTKASSGA